MATRRTATLEAKVLSSKDTVRKARAFLDGARAQHRAALLAASDGGIHTQRLADLTGTSWGRVDEALKRAAVEARPVRA